MADKTIPASFLNRVESSATTPAIWVFNEKQRRFDSWSWQMLAAGVERFCTTLEEQGIRQGDHVVQLSANRIEWILADLAIQFLGAVHIPFHSLSTAGQTASLLNHCRPKGIICSDAEQAAKIRGWLADTKSPRPAWFGFESDIDSDLSFDLLDPCTRVTDVKQTIVALKNRLMQSGIQSDSLLSILYTSGTTGESKGVMLTQDNVVANVESKLAVLPLTEQDLRLAILPFSHIFGRTCDIYTWIASGSQLALSRGREYWMEELKAVRPTYLNAVPYFYEKCYRELEQQNRLNEKGALQELLGGRLRIGNCGGAAVSEKVFDYFWEHDVALITGYGLTETSPVLSSSSPSNIRKNAVGPAVPGVELQIADDGEVLARGRNIMKGYFQNDLATQSAFKGDWFKTGDIGTIDKDGFLFLVGRKKEMIITNGGNNISPVKIESKLNRLPFVEHSVVVGDRQDFLTALLVVDVKQFEKTFGEFRESDEAASIHADAIQNLINESLNQFNRNEQVAGFCLTSQSFTIENGMLTAKASLRRQNILRAYGAQLEQTYRRIRNGTLKRTPETKG